MPGGHKHPTISVTNSGAWNQQKLWAQTAPGLQIWSLCWGAAPRGAAGHLSVPPGGLRGRFSDASVSVCVWSFSATSWRCLMTVVSFHRCPPHVGRADLQTAAAHSSLQFPHGHFEYWLLNCIYFSLHSWFECFLFCLLVRHLSDGH